MYTRYVLLLLIGVFLDNSRSSFDRLEANKRTKHFKSLILVVENQNKLNSVINFKVNNHLKSEFNRICKESYSNPSKELKVFMLKVVKQGHL